MKVVSGLAGSTEHQSSFDREILDRLIPWANARPEFDSSRVRSYEFPIGGAEDGGKGEGLPVRLYSPGVLGSLPTVVLVHGGHFVSGSISWAHVDSLARWLASEAKVMVVTPNYRLSPEHPFPLALDDVLLSLHWLQGGGPGMQRFDRSKVALLGLGAGANLAAAAALAWRDEARDQTERVSSRPREGFRSALGGIGGPFPSSKKKIVPVTLKALALGWPVMNPSEVPRDIPFLSSVSTGAVRLAAASYKWDGISPRHYFDPREASDFEGLPATFVALANADPFRSQGADFAGKVKAHAIEVEGPAGFLYSAKYSAGSRVARAELVSFLLKVFLFF